MRIGQNPARIDTPAYTPQKIGLASLVFIPHLEGYFQQGLSVLRAHLMSLHAHTEMPFDLLVFDNGSCREVKSFLNEMQAAGWIRWLVSSEVNLGKTGALNWILAALPNPIIGYADSDVFFRRGWLQASLDILEGFPQVGIVTAQPCFFDILRGEGRAAAHVFTSEQIEPYTPEDWVVEEYCRGINAPADLRQRYLSTPLPLVRNAQGVAAVLGASHMQFIAYREVLQQVLPLPATRGLSPEEDRVFNQRIDDLGYLHLSTSRPWVVHMGNTIDPHLQPEVEAALGTALSASPQPSLPSGGSLPRRWLGRLAKARPFKRYFLQLYNALYEIYSER